MQILLRVQAEIMPFSESKKAAKIQYSYGLAAQFATRGKLAVSCCKSVAKHDGLRGKITTHHATV